MVSQLIKVGGACHFASWETSKAGRFALSLLDTFLKTRGRASACSSLARRRAVREHQGTILTHPPGRNRRIAVAEATSIPDFSLPVTNQRMRRDRLRIG